MSWKHDNAQAKRQWAGPLEKYDLIQEGLIALVVVALLIILLSLLFGVPKVDAVTFQSWAKADPNDFVATTLTELAGTSETATYGPPYNDGTGQLQSLGPIAPQSWFGVQAPVNATQDFVIAPLTAYAPLSADLQKTLDQWNKASADQQAAWNKAAAAAKVSIDTAGAAPAVKLDGGDSGPIPAMMSAMLAMAQSGALDSQMIDNPGAGYSMDYTKSLLYLADGNYLGDVANTYNLSGEQWGVMNEIGKWPGQPWLWAYALWYNTPPFSNVGTDIFAIVMFALVMAVVFFLPFIPGLRSIPRVLRLYKWIWKPYYSKYGSAVTSTPSQGKTMAE